MANLGEMLGQLVANVIQSSMFCPLERAKLVLQTQAMETHRKYAGLVGTLAGLKKDDGCLGLWRGNMTELYEMLVFVPARVVISVAEGLFVAVVPMENFVGQFAHMSFSSALATLMFQPFRYARHRLYCDVAQPKEFAGVMDVLNKTCDGPQGLAGLYVGWWLRWGGMFAYRVAYSALQELIFAIVPQNETAYKAAQYLLVGLAAAATYPFELVEARLQRQATVPEADQKYTGVLDCARKTFKEEGLAGLFAGFSATLARTYTSILLGEVAMLAAA
eukprot:TRINITY_DN5764_c0_g1_i1.p2 TRINITY_DN5764_c0_g1~~TRINITY_DN5764_c0_g1_i1.p2  ORF type:complete len:276 (+),score=132.44 TRINITY_DN5764_c0_g1_i1:57-884(+)